MSFDWLSYLDLAEYMNGTANQFPDQDACYRCVASRAYYAVFCTARNYIQQNDNADVSDHQAVQDYLKKSGGNRARQRIGNQLQRLHQVRKKADYEDDLHESAVNTASKALSQARTIRDGLAALRS